MTTQKKTLAPDESGTFLLNPRLNPFSVTVVFKVIDFIGGEEGICEMDGYATISDVEDVKSGSASVAWFPLFASVLPGLGSSDDIKDVTLDGPVTAIKFDNLVQSASSIQIEVVQAGN